MLVPKSLNLKKINGLIDKIIKQIKDEEEQEIFEEINIGRL